VNKTIQSIVVVGGGTAGWITAGKIAAKYYASERPSVNVTLIESPNIKIVGVGEGTWPTMRKTLKGLGISETDFIRECDATFKQGSKFRKWVDGSESDYYYHPFTLPSDFITTDLAPYWQRDHQGISFSNAVCFQEQVCESGLAPKLISSPEYESIANYGYHLDAVKFSDFLKKHCIDKLGVRYITDDVTSIKPAKDGDIESLITKENGELKGDLFVDCTGFSSLLLGEHFKVPFVDKSDILFGDTALAVQVPYVQKDMPIATQTVSTAQEAGWIWDIGLMNRRGVGYVYSSRHTSHDQAESALRDYIGADIANLPVRRIPFRCGHRKHFWHRNCVAVGLSAGFLEPLEASALLLVELSADMICEQLPARREIMDIVARRFNELFLYRWNHIIEFLKLHYVLSKRVDNGFWNDNKRSETIPEELQERMKLWAYHSPWNHHFNGNMDLFPAASYQYVLYGMGFKGDFQHIRHTLAENEYAEEQFRRNRRVIDRAKDVLPSHRLLLEKVHRFGFQAI